MKIRSLLQPLLAVILGLGLGLLLTLFAGENPFHVASILAKSAFGSWYGFGMTLFYATPLIFTGLSVSIAFHAGLFNIGAEGQLTLGALAAAAMGGLFPQLPKFVAISFASIAAFFIGGIWGAIPGWLRARRGSHEVINTIMMNFIAAGLSSYVTLYFLKNPDSQNPESIAIGSNYLLAHASLFDGAPLSSAFIFALLTAWGVWFFLFKTTLGFELRAVGQNERAAQAAGINSGRIKILAMTLAGALAGAVGIAEVLGNAGKFRMGFSPDYGFIGIAVALLGRNRPLGVVAAALLFGGLHKGATDLDLETERVTKDLSQILQALVILSVCADGLWTWMKTNPRKRGEQPQ